MSNCNELENNPRKGLSEVFEAINYRLCNESQIDLNFSGSTCISVYFHKTSLFCANVGDSRAILGKKTNERWSVIPLSRDHKPTDKDEA